MCRNGASLPFFGSKALVGQHMQLTISCQLQSQCLCPSETGFGLMTISSWLSAFCCVLGCKMNLQCTFISPLNNAPCSGAQLRGKAAVQHHHCQHVGRMERGSAGATILSLNTKPQSVLQLLSEELRKFIMCKRQRQNYMSHTNQI